MKLLPLATWHEIRTEFVEGKGTIASLCQKHGALLVTAYARARREGWTRLRRERGEAQLAALVPKMAPPPEMLPTPQDEIGKKLLRLEAQLTRVDDLLDKEADPTRMDRLASAKARLFEQWRILSGVPMPGSRRPAREKPNRVPEEFPAPLD